MLYVVKEEDEQRTTSPIVTDQKITGKFKRVIAIREVLKINQNYVTKSKKKIPKKPFLIQMIPKTLKIQ